MILDGIYNLPQMLDSHLCEVTYKDVVLVTEISHAGCYCNKKFHLLLQELDAYISVFIFVSERTILCLYYAIVMSLL